ncbi:MAG: WD40 repeat domain-containing protein [Bacteroidetes bacterium]|nr:MAG: WD40 repeat domain-containing protein [Bacteroidota bacterium]
MFANENPSLVLTPDFIDFGPVLPTITKTLDIVIKPVGKDIKLNKTTLNSTVFSIIQGNISTPITLKENDSLLLKIEFSPIDSNLVYADLLIESDSNYINRVVLKGGFPFLKPHQKSLTITNPKCNQSILFGDTVIIEWDGVLPSDTVKLEYSTDKGYSWTIVKDRAGGLKYIWVPDFQSEDCLIRATQFWPDYSSGDIIIRHSSEVNSANFNNDGTLIITSTRDGKAEMFDAKNGLPIRTFEGHKASVRWSVFSPDTHYVATASDDSTAILWETNTGKIVRVLKGHGDAVRCVNFSSDSKKLVTASLDGFAYIWNVETGTVIDRIDAGQYDMLWYAEFHPSNNMVMTAGTEGTIKLWTFNPLKLSKRIDTLNSLIPFAAFSKSGNHIGGASWSGPAYVWDMTGKRITSVIHSDSVIGVVPINSVSFNYNEDSIITAGAGDFLAKIWNTYTGEQGQVLKGHKSAVQTAFFSPDGARVLTSSWDSTARIWYLYTYPLQSDSTDCGFKIKKPVLNVKDIDFGRIALGDSKDSTIDSILFNKSDFGFNIRNIFLSGANKTEFYIKDFKSTAFLDSSSSLNSDIKFEPLDTGLRTAKINWVIGNDTLHSNLNGYGVSPPIQKMVDEIDFGDVPADDLRDTLVKQFIKNNGNQKLDITLALIGRDSINYQILSPAGTVKLEPDSILQISLRFVPQNVGYKECTLIVNYTQQIVPCEIKIKGNGINPWRDTVTIELPIKDGNIGDNITIPIFIKNVSKADFNEMIDTIFTNISYNSTILEYIGSDKVELQGEKAELNLKLPAKNITDSVLFNLNFRSGLGNDSLTILKFDTVFYSGKGKLMILTSNGRFSLLGICKENEPRFFKQDGYISLSQNMPNPADNITKINFDIAESGITKIFIVDLLGNIVKNIVEKELKPGTYQIEFQVDELPSGEYYYILQTPTIRITRHLSIYK